MNINHKHKPTMAKFYPNRFLIAAALIASNYVYTTADNQIPDQQGASNAQDYKEGIIYDVRGPVKKVITLHNNKPYSHFLDAASFDTDGKTTGSITVFDNDGYPLGWSVVSDSLANKNKVNSVDEGNSNTHSFNISYKVSYDDNHRIASTMMESDVKGAKYEYANGVTAENRTFQYQNNQFGMPEIREMEMLSKIDGCEYYSISTYSNYEYDDHKNWVKRKVIENAHPVDAPQDIKTDEYVEKRAIYYY